jgi:CubicO group peptidase (beta-lactamase class C family)
VLAAFAASASGTDLDTYLREQVFASAVFETAHPDPEDVAGFAAYLDRYCAGLAVEAAAVQSL